MANPSGNPYCSPPINASVEVRVRRLILPHTLCGFLLALSASLVHAAATLQLIPFQAQFSVSRNGIQLGRLELQLEISATGEYSYTGHTIPAPLVRLFYSDEIHETSHGRYQGDTIIPLQYEHRRLRQGEQEKLTRLDFDWADKKVWSESEGSRWAQAVTPGSQDKVSQQLALRLDLAAGKERTSYAVADGGRIKTYHFKVVGRETIKLPNGRLKCLRVRRSKGTRPPDYTIWIAPELDYLPVKIERKRSSGLYKMELLSLDMSS